ncbi:hypothetical protein [Vibrio gazogenes]|uniref:Uncharacterized protein n=1 Tax=Vibrio gazogenes TaxID=687 RepID=A0A1Z2SB60_VIBGA|nr:hypothetical protein [Vibrio gazogenes]ASA54428.1 hypothetical protein BSQ33_00925 [Vibrio gazogenes]ASA58367.1 hypothetical protein BSQ33_21545 [Vibrio gazogenes]
MKTLSIDEINRDLNALDAADQLTSVLKAEIDKFKDMNPQKLVKQAMGMLMKGDMSLEALGLPVNLFDQIEQLEKINRVARAKYRARIIADRAMLGEIEPALMTEA